MEPSSLTIHQIGPDPRDPGGMASVIAEYVSMSDDLYKISSVPSWIPGKPIQSVTRALSIALRLLTGRARPDVAHVHLSERGSFLREGLVIWAASVRAIPVAASLHGADFPQFARRHPRLTRTVIRRCSRVVCLGPHQRRLVNNIVPHVPTDLILNPVSAPPAADALTQSTGPRVLFSGEVGTRKGFDRLLAAWPLVRRQLPDASLEVWGPLGDLKVPQVESVKWLGARPRAEVQSVYGRMDVTCLPSRREVLPMSILESLASGTPVVATLVGETAQFQSCRGAMLISEAQADSPQLLADAIVAAVTNHLGSSEVRALTEQWVALHASPEAVKRQLHDCYRKALEPAPSRARRMDVAIGADS